MRSINHPASIIKVIIIDGDSGIHANYATLLPRPVTIGSLRPITSRQGNTCLVSANATWQWGDKG